MASAATSFSRLPEHMEPHELVFSLSKMGKFRQIKQALGYRNREERKRIVSMKCNGATSLIMACRNGHLEIVEYLVDQCGANIEQAGLVNFEGENIEGAPPLWCASAAGHLKIVKYLVNNGANVNSTTKSNSTALRAACFDGHLEIVKFLVENNADIEIANRHGHTCLMIACYKGHLAIAKYLINKGADLNRKSVKGNTALHDCAECGSLDIMKLLLSHNATMAPDAYQMTPLLAAAVTGHAQIVEYLLQGCLSNLIFTDAKVILYIFHHAEKESNRIVVSADLKLPFRSVMFNNFKLSEFLLKMKESFLTK